MNNHTDPFPTDTLKAWVACGAARRWVTERNGSWNHDDWIGLLHLLQRRGPVEPEELGLVLEEIKEEPANVARWLASGEPMRWVAEHRGIWTHTDWLMLVERLRRSEYWPMLPARIGPALEQTRVRWLNLQRWLESGQARLWVELHHGAWNHGDWLTLLRQVQEFTDGEIDADQLGLALEAQKERYWNLRRWILSDGPRQWVEQRQGLWHHGDWQTLLVLLRKTIGEVDEAAVGLALDEARRRYINLQRWLNSGEARLWVEVHQGAWNHGDWLALLDRLERSGWCPIDPLGLGDLLEKLKSEYHNLRQWQRARQLRLHREERPRVVRRSAAEITGRALAA